MSTITPCPQCGSLRLDISVRIEAVQHITLHTPDADVPEEYSYTIQREDVTYKEVNSAFCTNDECRYEWVLDEE